MNVTNFCFSSKCDFFIKVVKTHHCTNALVCYSAQCVISNYTFIYPPSSELVYSAEISSYHDYQYLWYVLTHTKNVLQMIAGRQVSYVCC